MEIKLKAQDAADASDAVVVSRYNESITGRLLEGALATLRQAGVADERIGVYWVPGAWELPIVAQAALEAHDAAICLGAVIKGETTHDEHINRQVSLSLGEISLRTGKPIGFGLLTVLSLEQALQRAGGAVGNKGVEATEAAMETLAVLRRAKRAAES